jgi:hypothetical protein
MIKARQIIERISTRINHDSTIVVLELVIKVTGVVNAVEFIFEKMMINTLHLLNK